MNLIIKYILVKGMRVAHATRNKKNNLKANNQKELENSTILQMIL